MSIPPTQEPGEATPPAAHPWALAPGTVVGSYEIVRSIGAGGTALTYLARHRKTGQRVALKELFLQQPGYSCTRGGDGRTVIAPRGMEGVFETARRRLFREGETAADLVIDHLVRVYDALEENGTTYLVMEFVEGRTLQEEILDPAWTPWNPIQLRSFLADLAHVVEALHAAGRVHCDLKPGNIVMRDNRPVVIDLGLARLTGTPFWSVGHTPGYAPPEQVAAASDGDEAAETIDVYAVATIAGVLLTGAPPEHLDAALDHRPDLSTMAAAIRRARHPSAARRTPTVEAFRRDVVGASTPAVHRRPRRSTLLVTALVLAVAGLVSAIVVTVNERPTSIARPRPLAGVTVTPTARVVAGMIVPDAGGQLLSTTFSSITQVAREPDGHLWIADRGAHRVVLVDPDQTTKVILGTGRAVPAGSATPTRFSVLGPSGIATHGGATYYSDAGANRVYRRDGDGRTTVVAGTGAARSTGDGGPARRAAVRAPTALAVDAAGTVYVTEGQGGRVRAIDARGRIRTVMTGRSEVQRVETAAQTIHLPLSRFGDPRGILAFDDGTLILALEHGIVQRDVDSGQVTLLAGAVDADARVATKDRTRARRAKLTILSYGVGASGYGYLADAESDRILQLVNGQVHPMRVLGSAGPTTCGPSSVPRRARASSWSERLRVAS